MRRKKLFSLFVGCLIIVQSFTGILIGSPVVSAITSDEISSNMQKYSYYSAFHGCLLADTAGQFYNGQGAGNYPNIARSDYSLTIGFVVGSDGDNNDGAVTCSNAAKFVMSQLGFSEEELMKGLGYALTSGGSAWEKPCVGERHSANNACLKYASGSQLAASFKQVSEKKGIPTSEPDYGFYSFAFAGYTKACGATKIDEATASNQIKSMAKAGTGGYNYIKEITDTSGATVSAIYKIDASKANDSHFVYARPGDTNDYQGKVACKSMAIVLNGEAATRYVGFLQKQTFEEKKQAITAAIETYCAEKHPQGAASSGTVRDRDNYNYCVTNTQKAQQACWAQIRVKSTVPGIPDEYRDRTPEEKAQCMKDNGGEGSVTELIVLVKDIDNVLLSVTPELIDSDQGGGDDTAAVCIGGGLGYILCPLTTLVSDSITTLATYIEGFMRFDPLIGSEQGDAILNIWRLVVRIANIILVIAFMVVIFSQATSVGLSAYGIKKILPRIIAAAILINISFYICALAVDIANILGASMQGIISGASSEIGKGTGVVDAPNFGAALVAILVPLVLVIGVASFTGAIAFILPILVGGAVSLFFLFIVLALRHVITFMLIIVSPLAFAAMVLPNTDGIFKKWWKAFYISLALYPIIMALAYGSVLVSKVILVAAPDEQPEATIWAVFGFIALFAWIWALKSIVTWGGGLLSKVTGMVNDRSKGLIDRSRKKAEEWKGNTNYQRGKSYRKEAMRNYKNQKFAERMKGQDDDKLHPYDTYSRIAARGVAGNLGRIPKVDKVPLFGGGWQAQHKVINAAATGAAAAARTKEMEDEMKRLSNTPEGSSLPNLVRYVQNTRGLNGVQLGAAAELILKEGGGSAQIKSLLSDHRFMGGNLGASSGIVEAAKRSDKFSAKFPDLTDVMKNDPHFTTNATQERYVEGKTGKNWNVDPADPTKFTPDSFNWGVIGKKPDMIAKLDGSQAGAVKDHVTYQSAKTFMEMPDKSGVDAPIVTMMEEIFRKGPPTTP